MMAGLSGVHGSERGASANIRFGWTTRHPVGQPTSRVARPYACTGQIDRRRERFDRSSQAAHRRGSRCTARHGAQHPVPPNPLQQRPAPGHANRGHPLHGSGHRRGPRPRIPTSAPPGQVAGRPATQSPSLSNYPGAPRTSVRVLSGLQGRRVGPAHDEANPRRWPLHDAQGSC
jgi:hypothetical protein